jgi:hypothetical protein
VATQPTVEGELLGITSKAFCIAVEARERGDFWESQNPRIAAFLRGQEKSHTKPTSSREHFSSASGCQPISRPDKPLTRRAEV